MAVDANVLIYERIREERRAGRSPIQRASTPASRGRLRTIVDSNVTTLHRRRRAVLARLRPDPGFAVTLAIGILTTVFTAFTLTRLIVAWWFRIVRPRTVPI